MTTTIRAEDVRVVRGGRPILDGVSVSAAGGEVVGLVGPNGSGKTTLLGALAGLVDTAGGSVRLDGRAVAALAPEERGRRIGYLEQNPTAHWPLAAERVVMLGRAPRRAGIGGETAADRAAVDRALARCDAAAFAGRPVTELSGGERARVMLARVLAGEPEVLLADEPVAGLDPYHMLHVMELLRDLAREGMAVVVVLHDLALAIRFCDRLCLLDAGRLAAAGPPHAVLDGGDAERVFAVRLLRGPDWVLPWTRVEEER
ncbi:ABC transporter ATP-binding protein [Azospirillum halopraeferens]|uniref:ABC transporter ATP-binding protein n=1 Tax=Azospirillum halopraeferens TaxID=34010 RepID=UPI001FE0F0CC|nr:ABC transporter ATP-binding protein [Azospirillum halopraeferens]